ncbi:MAG TPA: hypothetical protein VFK02_15895 [Kofleriaceae bacterium]|nr:hypothetical protein [Kofleriaceae bacterium]
MPAVRRSTDATLASSEGVIDMLHEFVLDLVHTASDTRWAALRAVGLVQSGSFAPVLRGALQGRLPEERGVCALALARLGDPVDRSLLLRAWQEVSDAPVERVLTALAVLKIDPGSYGMVEERLRRDLEHSYLFEVPIQADIIEVLSAASDRRCHRLVEEWRPFYGAIGAASRARG